MTTSTGWSRRIRQLHRWLSILFVTTVAANFIAMALADNGTPPAAITYAPLFPLALLTASGLYLFVLPYRVKRKTDTPSS